MRVVRPSGIQKFRARLSSILTLVTTFSDPATQRKRFERIADKAALLSGYELQILGSDEYLMLMQPTIDGAGPGGKQIARFVGALKQEMSSACLLDDYEVEVVRRSCNTNPDSDQCASSRIYLVAIVPK